MNKITDRLRILGAIPGPVWRDGCEHGPECLIASFQIPLRGRLEKFDLYLFDEKHRGQSVCIRYGRKPEEYISPGPINQFIASACINMHALPEYWAAYEILMELGRLHWKPNPGPRPDPKWCFKR